MSLSGEYLFGRSFESKSSGNPSTRQQSKPFLLSFSNSLDCVTLVAREQHFFPLLSMQFCKLDLPAQPPPICAFCAHFSICSICKMRGLSPNNEGRTFLLLWVYLLFDNVYLFPRPFSTWLTWLVGFAETCCNCKQQYCQTYQNVVHLDKSFVYERYSVLTFNAEQDTSFYTS